MTNKDRVIELTTIDNIKITFFLSQVSALTHNKDRDYHTLIVCGGIYNIGPYDYESIRSCMKDYTNYYKLMEKEHNE